MYAYGTVQAAHQSHIKRTGTSTVIDGITTVRLYSYRTVVTLFKSETYKLYSYSYEQVLVPGTCILLWILYGNMVDFSVTLSVRFRYEYSTYGTSIP